jgi:hypothetical protein
MKCKGLGTVSINIGPVQKLKFCKLQIQIVSAKIKIYRSVESIDTDVNCHRKRTLQTAAAASLHDLLNIQVYGRLN